MNYKSIICILVSVCMLLCLASCIREVQQPQESESKTTAESRNETENQNEDDSEKIRVLTLEKTLHTYYDWADGLDTALVRSENSYVTLGQEDAELFPEMAETLNQISTMQKNAMEDEFDNLVSIAKDELAINEDGFETYVSTLDVDVRRADSVVISLLSDSYSDYDRIENYRVFHGSNYDTQTGKELVINDVIKNVNNDLAEAVEKELVSHMWTGEFYSEDTVEEYFANTPYDGISWTLDYIGVTFYFAPGDLCDEGAMTAMVSFAEYPELFYEKYMVVPAEYTVELPLSISFFAELDEDDVLEEISISGNYDEEYNKYLDYGIYTDTDAQCYYEECYVYDFHPYYVKTASGHYLYLFCEDFDEGMRQMKLVVLSLNKDGSVTQSGEMNVSPSWLADNKFIVPTDPDRFVLDELDNGTVKTSFSVGNDGMPVK